MSDRNTPKFGKPPLVETVLGVQFEPLMAMQIVHYGLFWVQVRDRFPTVEQHGALEPQSEQFNGRSDGPELKWKLMDRPELPRAWFLSPESADGQQLVQLQPDRFLLNWRRSDLVGQRYPTYEEKNRPTFDELLQKLVHFSEEHGLGSVKPNQCEVTYINHITIDEDCRTPAEMFARCFPGVGTEPSDTFLPRVPERSVYSCSFVMPERQGRLHVQVRPARVTKSGQEVLDLRLTARGAPKAAAIEAVLEWLDLGHQWVVCGFKSFTSPEMHKRWELKS